MNYIITFLTLFILTDVSGQFIVPDFVTYKIEEDQIMIRWEPKSLDDWNSSQSEGYIVEKYLHSDIPTLIETSKVYPEPEKSWQNKMVKDTLLQKFYDGAQQLLFADYSDVETMPFLELMEDGTNKESVDSFRLGLLAYVSTYDFDIAKMSGLGYQTTFKKGETYSFKIYTFSNKTEALEFKISTKDFKLPDVPKLEAKFGDKRVELKWRTKEYRKDYFGYYLERSVEDGNYQLLEDLPFVNLLDTLGAYESFAFFTHKDTLPRNYQDYWFRLKGMDYFGDKSILFSKVRGYGYDKINMSPIIELATQTADNRAHIVWDVFDRYIHLIESFEIVRADSLKGAFKSIVKNIDPNEREIKIKMDSTQNYFRVKINPKDGEDIYSVPVFVMGQDTLAPEIPENFSGRIDSNGVVYLTWDKNNKEKDFWGYKVFKSNFIEHEFSLINGTPQEENYCIDTADITMLNEYVYYKVQAVDTRNNRSAFTPVLEIHKPDKIAPAAAVMKMSHFRNDSIILNFSTSSSADVEYHELFKRDLDNEKSWKLLKRFSVTDSIDVYFDFDFEYDHRYIYTIIATDDAGLKSKPTKPYIVETKELKVRQPIQNIQINKSDQGELSFDWQLERKNDVARIEIYRGDTKDQIGLYKIIDTAESFIEPKSKNKNFYYFKALLHSNELTKFTNLIDVNAAIKE